MKRQKEFTWEEIRQKGMECYFQPIYNVKKKRIISMEALLRVHDGKGGYLNPELVVQDAEEDEWVSYLDLWILEQVCKSFHEFEVLGIQRVNVNLSPITCEEPDIVERICSLMKQYEIANSQIWFELTEMGHNVKIDKVIETVDVLQKQGIMFSMDDFGKGHSNLVRLVNFSFQSIKIDKELVWGMHVKKMAKPLVQAMLNFTIDHDVKTTAEGIETRQQALEMIEMGCDFLQGYLICEPLNIRDCLEFLKMVQDRDVLGTEKYLLNRASYLCQSNN